MIKRINIFKRIFNKIKYSKSLNRPIFDISFSYRNWLISQNSEELEKLAKDCKTETVKNVVYMTWASPEYCKFFNRNINDRAIKDMENMDITKAKGSVKKHKIEVWLGRPGLLIGYQGKLKAFIEEDLNIKLVIHEDKNTPWDQIHGLEYCACANNLDDLL